MQEGALIGPLAEHEWGIPWAAFGPNQEVGLTDEEYLWEPAPGGWSLRRRGEATSPMAYGAGDWVLDFALPEPKPPQ